MIERLLFPIALLGSACASTPAEPPLPEQWLGVTTRELLDAWGKPDDVIEGEHGHTVYVFQGAERDRRSSLRNPEHYRPGQDAMEYLERSRDFTANRQHIASDVVINHCTVLFAVHPDDAVVAWYWQGNRCRNSFVRRVLLEDASFQVMRSTPDETPDYERAVGPNEDYEAAKRAIEEAMKTR